MRGADSTRADTAALLARLIASERERVRAALDEFNDALARLEQPAKTVKEARRDDALHELRALEAAALGFLNDPVWFDGDGPLTGAAETRAFEPVERVALGLPAEFYRGA